MSSEPIEYLKIVGIGATFGITTSILSHISNQTTGTPLGFSPLSIKKLAKVGLISGATLTALIAADEKWKIVDSFNI